MKQIILAIMFVFSFSTGIIQASESPKEQYLCGKTNKGNLSCNSVEIKMTSESENIKKLENSTKTEATVPKDSNEWMGLALGTGIALSAVLIIFL